jgi:23S rRNA pseudouridine2605 synthase
LSKKLLDQDRGEKLTKFLARCGIGSRRKCDEYIRAGWVTVDNKIVDTAESRVLVDQQTIRFRGEIVKPQEKYRYIILNKPEGIICTSAKGREKGKTVLDLVKVPERVYNVGRLDKDSSGLLLLTSDGELAQSLTHPSFEKEKEYQIVTTNTVERSHLTKLSRGIELDDGLSKFKSAELIEHNEMRVVLTQGRKRQIRRTLQAVGLKVKSLHRIRIGDLHIGDLEKGRWRDLTEEELKRLMR